MIRASAATVVIGSLLAVFFPCAPPSTAQSRDPASALLAPGGNVTADTETVLGGLTGRWTFNGGGALRICLRELRRSPRHGGSSVDIGIVNEGDRKITISPQDRWWLVTSTGKTVPLVPERYEGLNGGSSKRSAVPPHDERVLSFTAAEKLEAAIAAVGYRSDSLEREFEARSTYRAPKARLVVPPTLPGGSPLPQGRVEVELAAAIGTDGRVESVDLIRASKGQEDGNLAAAARAALKQWVFEPALENDEPTRWCHVETFEFRAAHVARGAFPPPADVAPERLGAMLQRSFTRVIPLRSVGGFVVQGHRNESNGVESARVFLVRSGALPDGSGSWVAVNAFGLYRRTGGRSCGCVWRQYQGSAAEQFLEWLASEIGTASSSISLLYPHHDCVIPSGQLEPAAAGTWNRAVLRQITLQAIAEGSPNELGEPPVLPAEAEILSATGILPFMRTPEPPERTNRVDPVYPEMARKARIQGKVVLEAVIDSKGDVTEVEVIEGNPLLDEAAMAAVCCWKYRPATIDYKPIEITFMVVVDFTLN